MNHYIGSKKSRGGAPRALTVKSSELGEGSSPASRFGCEVVQNKEGAKGILTGGFTGSRRQCEGLTTVHSFSAPMRPVVVTSGEDP
jgi:hypothetical protein